MPPRAALGQRFEAELWVSTAHRTAGQKAAPSRGVATKAVNELAMIAGEAEFIAGTALTMVGMTLVVRGAADQGRCGSFASSAICQRVLTI